ncbi:class C sortase [Salipaludibacillus aurantiacus]|uniref:class C sortase n=1 Tax=Salipaludibacillus aurantiacus TaxID=1601833 RepID=UPI001FE0B7EA|nr:class C sortase [Salipaludibacillus aurantiacus]
MIIILTFLVGAGLLLYPHVSHWWMTERHINIIQNYDGNVSAMSEREKQQQLENVKRFNENINFEEAPLTDPFETSPDEELEGSGYYNLLNVGETMGYVNIPLIDIRLPIFHGTGDDVLDRGAGHMSNTSMPGGGENTHTVITAHRGLARTKMFRDLDQLKVGDIFEIQVLDETLHYEVEHIEKVLPHETELLALQEGRDLATLITCTPYGINTHRLLVTGERIHAEEEKVDQEVSTSQSFPWHWIVVLVLISITIIVAKKVRKKRQDNV